MKPEVYKSQFAIPGKRKNLLETKTGKKILSTELSCRETLMIRDRTHFS